MKTLPEFKTTNVLCTEQRQRLYDLVAPALEGRSYHERLELDHVWVLNSENKMRRRLRTCKDWFIAEYYCYTTMAWKRLEMFDLNSVSTNGGFVWCLAANGKRWVF